MHKLDTIRDSLVYLAGHTGMVGSATQQELVKSGFLNIVTTEPDYDLRSQALVNQFFAKAKPDVVIVAAARVGGILANSHYPYDFIYDNLAIEANLIHAAISNGVEKLVFLGSSCIYPRLATQPLKEEYLLEGQLEPTNEWYALAKIAGIKLCQAANRQFGHRYISLMPTNLYGERDNFDLQTSHVLPAMLRKFHDALPDKDVTLWGTGTPLREFMHVSDLAKAIVFVLENECPEDLYNVGVGTDLSIRQLAELVQKSVGHTGKIIWDSGKPDGTPQKLLDVSRMSELGWFATLTLEEGLQTTYEWFLEHIDTLREVRHG